MHQEILKPVWDNPNGFCRYKHVEVPCAVGKGNTCFGILDVTVVTASLHLAYQAGQSEEANNSLASSFSFPFLFFK